MEGGTSLADLQTLQDNRKLNNLEQTLWKTQLSNLTQEELRSPE